MYNTYRTYPCTYCAGTPGYNHDDMYNAYNTNPCPYFANAPLYGQGFSRQYSDFYAPFADEIESGSRIGPLQPPMGNNPIALKDYGPQPFSVNISAAAKQNKNFRTSLWTGRHLQVTLMSINVGDDIGLEMHPNVDQFIRIEDGQGTIRMGKNKNRLDYQASVYDDFAIIVPAGTWHNIINTGNRPLKVYSIYAPPQHPHGTVHITKPVE